MDDLRDAILVGCGNPLLDISANVDDALLAKYDLKPNDAILGESKHTKLYEELIQKYNAEFLAGGSVQNSLRVCQWMLQRPGATAFFGCVGRDKYAKILERVARKSGVSVYYQYVDDKATGTCGVLITGTQRSLCANLAAANLFSVEHFEKPEHKIVLDHAKYFYISGFFLTVNTEAILTVAKHASELNRVFLMNLSAPFLSQFFMEPLMEVMPYVDVLFGNETEAETFAQVNGWSTSDLKEIGKKMVTLPKKNASRPRIVIITQGQEPVLLIEHDACTEFPVVQIDRRKVVDTNGAGDAFVGGFLAQFVQKQPLSVCVRSGIWAAGIIIQHSGCSFEGLPDFHE